MWRGRASRPALHRNAFPRPGRERAAALGRGSEGARGHLRLPGRVRAVRALPVHTRPHDTAARGAEHSVTATFSPDLLTQPLTCKTPPAAHAGAQSLGAQGTWLAPPAQVEVKAGHCAASSQFLSPDPAVFFPPEPRASSSQHPHTAGGCGWAGLLPLRVLVEGGAQMGQRGAPSPHLLPPCSAPLRISPGARGGLVQLPGPR